MGLPNTSINVTGEIVRPALDKDGIAGLVLYNNNIADLTVFTATENIVKFTNLSAIEATGITKDSTNFKEEHYQLSEFFRAGGGEIYIGIFEIPTGTYDYTELDELNLFSNGEIRLYGVYNTQSELSTSDLGLINSLVESYKVNKKPSIAIVAQNIGTLTLNTLPDLRNLSTSLESVSVVIGQETDNVKYTLPTTKSTPNLGIVLGTLAIASVEENILNVGKYNYTDGTNMVNPGLVINDGTTDNVLTLISSINDADLNAINDKGYIFWRFFPNYAGTYLSNDNNCAKITDTFNSVHINRVQGKVIRITDGALTPLVGSTLLFNPDGTLRTASRKNFEDAVGEVMLTMLNDGEISAYEVYVDPTQESLASKQVIVQISIVATESADNIAINIAFVTSI